MPPDIRLLLLSVGGGVAHNFFDALGERRSRCVLIGTNSLVDAASSYRCDTVYTVPPAADREAYRARIEALIDAERPDIVIPFRDDDVLVLAELAARHRNDRPVLLTGSVAAARIVNDKVETARFAARHGLPFAPTAENASAAQALATAHGLPLIGKPRAGNASRGVVLLRSAEEIERAFARSADLIAQPYLDPPRDPAQVMPVFDAGLPLFFSVPGRSKYSVQVFVGPDGAVSESFGTLSVETSGSATEYRRRDDPDLLELGQAYGRACAAEGWRGPLNVQLKRRPAGVLVAFEVNGRFTGGTGPRAVLGFDEIGEVMSRFLPGKPFDRLPSARVADIAQSYLASYPVPQSAAGVLRARGRWPDA